MKLSYLYRSRHGIYYYRRVCSLTGRETRRSLRTRCKREAVLLAAEYIANGRAAPSVAEPVSHVPLLSELIRIHGGQQTLSGVSLKSIRYSRAVIHLLILLVGDKPIDQYDTADARLFRDKGMRLPPRVTRLLGRMTIDEAINAADGKTISVTTLNNNMRNLASFFAWVIREGYPLTVNPFRGMQVRQRVKANSFRGVYSADQVKAVFGATRHEAVGWKYWLPRLGYYTGARLNELCQLYADDIVEADGVPCIHVRATRAEQSLKTLSSDRLIPIHSELIKLGFVEYVSATAVGRLFPELKHSELSGYSLPASRWYGRLKSKLELGSLDFHSLRHTFVDQLKQHGGFDETHVAALVGHSGSTGITFGRYGKDYPAARLVEAVEAIQRVSDG